MKKGTLVLIIFLVALVAVGWISQIGHIAGSSAAYKANMEQADLFCEEGLYQKAIQSYEVALKQKETQEAREKWVAAHRGAYEEGVMDASDYAKAMVQMNELYPEYLACWKERLQHHIGLEEYSKAYECYEDFLKEGLKDEEFILVANQVIYSFKTFRKTYTDFVRNADGSYAVRDINGWGILETSGERSHDCDYSYVGPYNSERKAVFVSDIGTRIADEKNVIDVKFNVEFVKTGTYADGLLPVCSEDGVWRYFDVENKELLSAKYEAASNYTNGIAAVCQKGEWKLIDTEGDEVCNNTFADIKLHSNGDYVFDGVMVASEKDTYGMYDGSGESINDFESADMDIFLGEAVAFMDESGKWGFVDKKGDVVLEPAFQQAKSFSHELAAVSDGESWGYVDGTGAMVIEQQFLNADYFSKSGLTMVGVTTGEYYSIMLRYAGGK